MLHFVPCARKRSFVALAVMASLAGLGMATAMRAAAQTAPPVRSAVVPPTAAAVPSVPAVAPPAAATSGARPPQRAASQPVPKVAGASRLPSAVGQPASPPKPSAASHGMAAGPATARRVALDVGHVPGGGSRSASGVAEHNFNLRFAAALENKLKQQGIAVRRLPTTLSLAERAQRAHGAVLVVSVHHDGTAVAALPRVASASAGSATARKVPVAATGSGFQLRVGQVEPTACARAVATQLQAAGRHFSTGGSGPWADKALGVRAGGEGALLQQADVPVLQVSLADIANPAEERLAANAAWLDHQAAAVAKGLGQCLQRPVGGVAPALPPAAAASGARRA